MRERRLDTELRFLVTKETKERLEHLCEELGHLPSRVLRRGLERELERLERERDLLATYN